MSLLLLGYQAKVGIESYNSYTDTMSSANNSLITFDMDKGHRTATYIVNNIVARTNSAVQTDVLTNLEIMVDVDEKLSIVPAGYEINGQKITDNKDSPTEITISTGNNIKIYASRDTKGKKIIFYIKDVPIGAQVPDIKFDTYIGNPGNSNDVKNNDRRF